MTSLIDVLNEAIEAEHMAVYAYPVIGARIDSLADVAITQWKVHQKRRDALIVLVEKQNRQATLPQAAYAIGELSTREDGGQLAQQLETECAARYASLILGNEAMPEAIQWLVESSATVFEFGGKPEAFPGLNEDH